ncbi:ROK family transcriptional regulator [Nocardioides abyssi]|uniref:ROK family transcriptional regulator n=1 Tax=Nocardioides abyssi TaxID=3058370 RepID=A0ABT8ESU4_9ACTN|nr:ROK family transcriptional regulator [Nocardioides abyssi]MDN4161232.1 ROK family transcriptional regulator [Nocardioides abyssi]
MSTSPGPVETTAGGLLSLVRGGEATTRADLGRATGLSRTAVSQRVSALVGAGLLVEGGGLASTGGRPAGALAFNVDAAVVVGIAVGRSRTQVGVFDLEGREIVGDTRDHEVGSGPDEVMTGVAERLRTLLVGIEPPVLGIGLSLPGTVDPERRVSVDAPVMKGWDGVALAPYLTDACTAPLHLTNDTSALTRSELFGPAPLGSDVLVVKASTGLGIGVIADGRLVNGSRGVTGELGHTRVEGADELLCRCGAHGCLETVAAGWAMVNRLVEGGAEARHVRDLVALALDGDPVARSLLRESGRRVGEVLAVAVNLLHPQTVVVGGDMGSAFDLYTAGMRESVYARAAGSVTRDLRFAPAAHGDSAGLVGCAALVIDHELSPAAVDARLRAARAEA